MNREELVAAMDAGLPVRWKNDGYRLYRDTLGQYLQTFEPNVDPKDCYIKESK